MSIASIDKKVVTSLEAVNEQRLDVQLRLLEFHAMLHRKLDLQQLLESFLVEGQAFLRFDGLQYLPAERGMDLLLGEMRQHRQCFQLKLGETDLGDIVFMRSKAFSSREQRETERLVESLIYPLDNALEHYSALLAKMTDKTTGVHNQMAIDQQLPREIRYARRGEQPLSLMLLTVDYLESISEHHGEDVGRDAWQAVAEALSELLRQSDIIFRTDNDEFLVILNHTGIDAALSLTDRLRKQVDRCVSYDNVQFVLTASAGVTEMNEEDDAQSLLDRARQALSLARQSGRNQMMSLPVEPSTGGDSPDGGSAA